MYMNKSYRLILVIALGIILFSCQSTGAPPQGDPGLLQAALFSEDLQLLETALITGADPNSPNSDGVYPLYIAVFVNNPAAVDMLLDYGADPNLQAPDGSTALTLAIQEGHPRIAALLIERGSIIGLRNDSGQTALMFASQYAMPEVAAMLLDRGADPNAHAADGTTPLIFALAFGHTQLREILLEAGAEAGAGNIHQQTPLMVAASTGDVESIMRLIIAGADVNAMDEWGRQPLHYATLNNQLESAVLLLKLGGSTVFPFSSIDYPDEAASRELFSETPGPREIQLSLRGDPIPSDIPQRVSYRLPPRSAFTSAIGEVENFLRSGYEESDLFGDVLIIGPYLTRILADVPALQGLNPNKLLMRFNEADAILEKAYQEDGIPILANYLRNRLCDAGEVIIRAPSAAELDWYWTIISYDLEDVVLVLETVDSRFFVEFTGDRIFTLHEWTYLSIK
jgi:ankyrin repeat protein